MRRTASKFVFCVFVLLHVCTPALRAESTSLPATPGQALTLLTDGSILATGGLIQGKALNDAYLLDATGNVKKLKSGLLFSRAGHTATALPDGTVLIFGGTDGNNHYLRSMELFDPHTLRFMQCSGPPLTPRTFHTGTLLTDGRVVIIGGTGEGGTYPSDIQLWDFRTGGIESIDISSLHPRQGHKATLLADGRVLISGGHDLQGTPVKHVEAYYPDEKIFQAIPDTSPTTEDSEVLTLAASIPIDGAEQYQISDFVTLRFSRLIASTTANIQTIRIVASDGTVVPAPVTSAERGRLAFLLPTTPLLANSDYTINVDGVEDLNGNPLTDTVIHFHTDGGSTDDGSDDGWIPDADALKGNWNSKTELSRWQKLPPRKAPAGITALAGQVLGLSGTPIAHVTLQIERNLVESDGTGRFLLTKLSPGHHVLVIDGRKANKIHATYGLFEAGVDIKANVTTVLNYTVWMTKLDTVHAVTIPSPTIAQDTVITNPLIPGLELHLPAGTTLVDREGRSVRQLSITPIPLDKPPFPLPTGLKVPLYFTIQPGGANIKVQGSGAVPKGVQLYYPNTYHEHAGTIYNFWNYDAASRGWYIYGNGRVDSSGTHITPDAGVFVYELTGAMVGGGGAKNAIGANGSGTDGDPVDLSSGQLVYSKTDLSLPDVIPIQMVRTYTTNDHYQRSFGIGATNNYDIFMVGDIQPYTYQELIDPTGVATRFNRISAGTGYGDAVYVSTSSQGPWYGATISWNMTTIPGASWILKTRAGMLLGFPDSDFRNDQVDQALVGIQDRNGNTVVLTRDTNAILTKITSPMGRYISLDHDALNRITQATDNAGRNVSYTYDSGGRLATASDVNGDITMFAYNSNDQVTTITDPMGTTYLTNQYDSFGRVIEQTQADGGTYSFQWTPSANTAQQFITSGQPVDRYNLSEYEGYTGLISQVNVTDPKGYVRQVVFNNLGMKTSDTRALGQPEYESRSYLYYADNLLKQMTDPLGRVTAFDYDASGNTTSVTSLAGTTNATTYTLTYDQIYSNVLSITDPLNHTSTFSYDSHGNLANAQDSLGNVATASYNSTGQAISVTDALGNSFRYFYYGGDLTATKDPVGNRTVRFLDQAGRVTSVIDPMGHATHYQFDNGNKVTSVTNAQGHQATLAYDANGNLLSLQDFLGHATHYTYDSMDRPITRTDSLQRTATVTYDLGGNPVSGVDRKGQLTSSTFDGLGRTVFMGYGTATGGPGTTYESTISYQYDSGNRMIAAVDSGSGTISRIYDGLNRLTGETTPRGNISYTYDAAGRRVTAHPSSGALTSYDYDDANRLVSITQTFSHVGLSYDSAGRRTALALPNGVSVQYAYDQDSRLQNITYAAGGNAIGNLFYQYDAAGRNTELDGSLAHTNLPFVLGQASYDAANQLTSWDNIVPAYDDDGNMTADVTGNQYVWNARNQLVGITGAASASFSYDSFNRRISKHIGPQTVGYEYDGANRVSETSGTSTASLLPGGIDEYFQRSEASGVTVPIADALGSTIGTIDASGNLATTYWYDPYGSTTIAGTTSSNSTEYAGRENDGLKLYFYRARYYNPETGRFISEDPIGLLGGINEYAYVGDNPTGYVDPSGLDKQAPERKDECWNGIGEASLGLLTTVGAVGVVVYIGPEAVAAAGLEVGIEGGMATIHVLSALGTLLAMPVTALMDGVHRTAANCGTP
jgi:RHS repeat-associated protein